MAVQPLIARIAITPSLSALPGPTWAATTTSLGLLVLTPRRVNGYISNLEGYHHLEKVIGDKRKDDSLSQSTKYPSSPLPHSRIFPSVIHPNSHFHTHTPRQPQTLREDSQEASLVGGTSVLPLHATWPSPCFDLYSVYFVLLRPGTVMRQNRPSIA